MIELHPSNEKFVATYSSPFGVPAGARYGFPLGFDDKLRCFASEMPSNKPGAPIRPRRNVFLVVQLDDNVADTINATGLLNGIYVFLAKRGANAGTT
jgi:hypothetical protein